jgi:hypothetical protein
MNAVLLSYIASVLAGLSLFPLAKFCIAVWDRLFRDLPDIAGKWKTQYKFVRDGKDEVEATESVTVRKKGRWCVGRATMKGEFNRTWHLSGEIRGRYWSGKVYADDRHTLSGSGVFQLKVWEHARRMEGHMLWWDGELDRIYVTPYLWHREQEHPS